MKKGIPQNSITPQAKVRNPWGEWTRREQDELLAQLGAAVVPDEGSFWMSLGFMLGGSLGTLILTTGFCS